MLNLIPEELASQVPVSFFPKHQQIPVALPSIDDLADTSGLIATIESTRRHSSPDYDNNPYALFKNMEGDAFVLLLQATDEV